MSVSSDFWESQEPRGSSAIRLARAFRRESTVSASASSKRDVGVSDVVVPRRSSLAALPFRLTKSRSSIMKMVTVVRQPEQDPGNRLGFLLLSLPNEIQVQIISYLELPDIFALRLSSRSALALLQISASAVSRSLLMRTYLAEDPIYLQCLYPQPTPCPNLGYLLQMLHRQAVVQQILDLVVEFIQTKIYLIKTGPRVKQFQPYRQRLIQRLRKPAFIIYHYLENLQRLHLHSSSDQQLHDYRSYISTAYQTALPDLVDSYPKEDVVSAFQFYKLLILDLRQSLRAPTYAGTLERTLRGWGREPARDDEIAQLLVFGGMEQVLRIIQPTSYAARLDRVKVFVEILEGYAARKSPGAIPAPPKPLGVELTSIQHFDLPFHRINSKVLELTPPLDEILTPVFQDRIVLEKLVDHERELASPFGYVQTIMADPAAVERLGSEDMTDENAGQTGTVRLPSNS